MEITKENLKENHSKKELVYYNYKNSGYYTNGYPFKKIRERLLKQEPNGQRLKYEVVFI